jgi:DNA processing protein
MDQSVYWIWLQNLRKMQVGEKLELVRRFQTPFGVYENRAGLKLEGNLDHANRILERHDALGIEMITPDHERYESGMPLAVYYKGHLVDGSSMAVVGTRKCSADGYYYTVNAVGKLISEGVCINSGLAIGVDEHAHREALISGGKVQAFLANGLDECYPKKNKWMMNRIAESGAVISPFAAGIAPMRHRFLERNALMVAMSDAVLVVEASKKSGALNTAMHAKKLSKPIWTIRGPEDSPRCEGNNRLLSEGALEYEVKPSFRQGKERELVEILKISPMSTETLSKLSGIEYNFLDMMLYDLECDYWLNFKGDGKWHYNGW